MNYSHTDINATTSILPKDFLCVFGVEGGYEGGIEGVKVNYLNPRPRRSY